GKHRALGLVGSPAVSRPVSMQPVDGTFELSRLAPNSRHGQAHKCRGLDRAAPQRRLTGSFPVEPVAAAWSGTLMLGSGSENAENLTGQLGPVEIGECECKVSERRVRQALALAIETVGHLEARTPAGAEG